MKRLTEAVNGVFKYETPKGLKRWAIDYVDPVTHKEKREAGFVKKMDALARRAELNELELAIYQGADPATDELLFHDLIDRFLKDYNSRSGDLLFYRQRAKAWRKYLPNVVVSRIRVEDIDRFRKEREAQGRDDDSKPRAGGKAKRLPKVGPTTIRHDLVALSTMFKWAMARKLVKENPAAPELVRRPARPAKDPRPLSDAQVVALLDACPAWLALIVELAIETGLDYGELLGLKWHRHVNATRKIIIVPRAKTGVGRTIPYGKSAAIKRILREAGKVRDKSGAVFLNAHGAPATYHGTMIALRRTMKKAVGPWPRPWKSLRATCATRMVERGLAVPVVAAALGLTTSHVFEHYVKPSGAHLEDAFADHPAPQSARPER